MCDRIGAPCLESQQHTCYVNLVWEWQRSQHTPGSLSDSSSLVVFSRVSRWREPLCTGFCPNSIGRVVYYLLFNWFDFDMIFPAHLEKIPYHLPSYVCLTRRHQKPPPSVSSFKQTLRGWNRVVPEEVLSEIPIHWNQIQWKCHQVMKFI